MVTNATHRAIVFVRCSFWAHCSSSVVTLLSLQEVETVQGLQGKETLALKQEEKIHARVKKGKVENLSIDTRMSSFDKDSGKKKDCSGTAYHVYFGALRFNSIQFQFQFYYFYTIYKEETT